MIFNLTNQRYYALLIVSYLYLLKNRKMYLKYITLSQLVTQT